MNDELKGRRLPDASSRLLGEIDSRNRRRDRESGFKDRGFWIGVGAMGLIGWGVVVPAVAGGFIGIWLDGLLGLSRTFSALLALAGLCLGCWNAWRMTSKVLDNHGEGDEKPEDVPDTRKSKTAGDSVQSVQGPDVRKT